MKRHLTFSKIGSVILVLFLGMMVCSIIIEQTQNALASHYKVGDLTTSDTLTVYGVFRVGGDQTTTTTFSTIDSSQMIISNIILTTDSTYTRLNSDSLVAKEYFTVGDTTTGDHDSIIYFADDGNYKAESLIWDDGDSRFEISDDFTPTSDQSSDIGAAATKFNHGYFDSLHANYYGGNSPMTLGVKGERVTIRGDLCVNNRITVQAPNGKEVEIDLYQLSMALEEKTGRSIVIEKRRSLLEKIKSIF